MRAPKCRLCGIEHWGSVCSPKKSAAARKDVPVKQGGALVHTAPRPMRAIEPAGNQALPVDTHSKAQFDRNEYQRLYMRDKAAIKRLGLNCTVAVYRASEYKESEK